MECKFLGIDIQDNQGRHEVGYMENTVRGENLALKVNGPESGRSRYRAVPKTSSQTLLKILNIM